MQDAACSHQTPSHGGENPQAVQDSRLPACLAADTVPSRHRNVIENFTLETPPRSHEYLGKFSSLECRGPVSHRCVAAVE